MLCGNECIVLVKLRREKRDSLFFLVIQVMVLLIFKQEEWVD